MSATTYINLFDALLGEYDLNGIWTDLDSSGLDISNPYSVNTSGICEEGIYRFEYCVESNGCRSCSIVNLNICYKPQISIVSGQTEYCVGEEIFLSANTNADLVIWTLPNGRTSNRNPLTITAYRSLGGEYCVNGYSLCGASCGVEKCVYITIVDKPSSGVSSTVKIRDCNTIPNIPFENSEN